MKTHRIALIPGDGIGVDVVDAAWIVLEAAAARFGLHAGRHEVRLVLRLLPAAWAA